MVLPSKSWSCHASWSPPRRSHPAASPGVRGRARWEEREFILPCGNPHDGCKFRIHDQKNGACPKSTIEDVAWTSQKSIPTSLSVNFCSFLNQMAQQTDEIPKMGFLPHPRFGSLRSSCSGSSCLSQHGGAVAVAGGAPVPGRHLVCRARRPPGAAGGSVLPPEPEPALSLPSPNIAFFGSGLRGNPPRVRQKTLLGDRG